MANQSAFLGLILAGFNEYTDAWDKIINSNFESLDRFASDVSTEIANARFSKASLKAFLEVGHNTDGTIKPLEEVAIAQASPYLGRKTSLSERVSQVEKQVWQASLSQGDLLLGLSLRDKISKVISAPSNWLTHSDAKVKIDGSTTNIWFLHEGKPCRVRTLKDATVSGSSGTRYIYVEYQANGVQTKSGSAGVISTDSNGDATYFTESGVDFTNLDVKSGDILRISGLSDDNAKVNGDYVVKTVAPGAVNSRLEIVGKFPVLSLSAITYEVRDPYGVNFGTDSSGSTSGRLYVGTCEFDGTNVSADPAEKNTGDTYISSSWTSVSSSGSDFFSATGLSFDHNLMSDALDVQVQVKASLSATEVEAYSAVKVKWDTKRVWVKSSVPYSSTFYTKYDGTTAGSLVLRVIVTKRG